MAAAGLGCLIPNNTNSPLHSPWGITFFWLTLIINLYATGIWSTVSVLVQISHHIMPTVLIATRLWTLHRQITSAGIPSLALTAATVIIESCAAYSFCLVLLIVFSMEGTTSQDIMLDSMSPIMVNLHWVPYKTRWLTPRDSTPQGIIFSIVIFRLALGVSSDGPTLSTMHELKLSRLVFQRSSPGHDNSSCEEASCTVTDQINSFSGISDYTDSQTWQLMTIVNGKIR